MGTEHSDQPAAASNHAQLVSWFLEWACWDHHVHGKSDHRMCDRAAARLLAHYPEIARDSLYTAIVCGDIDEVRRILAERPEAAREPGGSRGWTPFLYLCFTRFSHQQTIDNAVEVAGLLLNLGADPNDFYMAGDARYSALTGVAGEGEQDSPRQPQAQGLFQLLLERGAEPFDIQVLYNTHFSGDMLWWLELVYTYTAATGRRSAWDDPSWQMLDMGGYGSGAYFLLNVAIEKNDLKLAEWLLAHGADPNATSSHRKFRLRRTLYEQAVLEGQSDMTDLLLRYGAIAKTPELSEEESFVAAGFRLDREQAAELARAHPEFIQSPEAMFAAARKDRADVVELLLDLGVPIEVSDDRNTRTLHHAAFCNARSVASLLIERGAEIDPIESIHQSPPIGWATHGDHTEMIEFLSRRSRDVWRLAFNGCVDRLREVLQSEPGLATLVDEDSITPLWWLPDDDAKAYQIAELLITHGADPSIKSKQGRTAADWARKRGMLDVARCLGWDESKESTAAPPAGIEEYESLAQDLLFAYETGQPKAMQHLQQRYGETLTWDSLRASVRSRLDAIPKAEQPPGYIALPHARLLVARHAGFQTWAALDESLRATEVA